MIQPNLAIRRTFPQVKPALRAAVGGGKVRRGGATFRFRGVALPSVLGGSVWALGWLYFAVQLVLMGRYLHKDLMNEKSNLQQQLSQIADTKQKRETAQSRLDDIYMILDGLKNHPMQYDDRIIRQIIECVVVESKDEIKVIFIGGLGNNGTIRSMTPIAIQPSRNRWLFALENFVVSWEKGMTY